MGMRTSEKPKIKVRNLTKRFGDLLVLDDMSFDVMQGEFLCVVGPTGCGKTTFLNSLAKLYGPTSGDILIHDERVHLDKHNISYIFQEKSKMPWLTVEKNIAFGLEIKRKSKKEVYMAVDKMLELVGLTKFRHYYPAELSLSMLQRVVIARAFSTEAELLLMDEPYGQLDIELRFKLEDDLVEIWERMGTTVIFTTHNIEEAVYLSERILILSNKPSRVKKELINDLPRPRSISADKFVEIRNEVTEQIKWW